LSKNQITGITATCSGFYGPQGRTIRAPLKKYDLIDILAAFRHGQSIITNFEMETSAIYGLASVFGHQACSVNAIIANRPNKVFSSNADRSVDRMIKTVIDLLL
jgi:uridine phosphorylase